MKENVKRLTAIPDNSVIGNGFGKIDYCDSYRMVKVTDGTAEAIAAEILKPQKWVNWLMVIRDSIVGLFGLKTGKEIMEGPITGFPIIEKRENEIVMGENDRHLDFRLSVLIDRENSFIYLTTVVCFNNLFGKLYFLPVKPFHKIIVKSSLKRYNDEKDIIIQ
jgi:hypothetical protein